MMDFERRRFLGAAVVWRRGSTSGLIGRALLNQRASAAANAADPVSPGHGRAVARGRRAGGRRHHAAGRAERQLLSDRHQPAHPARGRGQLVADGERAWSTRLTITYDELLAMPLVEQYVTIACVSNKVGGDLVGNALWRGVRLRDVLGSGRRPGGAPPRSSAAPSTAGPPASQPPGPIDDRAGAGGGGHERRSAAVRARLSGAADHPRPVRLRIRHQVAHEHRADHARGVRRLLGAAGLGQGGADPDPVAHRRAAVRRLGDTASSHRGVAWAPDRGVSEVEVRRRGPGRRRSVEPLADADLGAVALSVGRSGRRPHLPRPCDRRYRRGADRHGHRARSPTERADHIPSTSEKR